MSLTDFVKRPEVSTLLKPLRPNPPRRIPAKQVVPASNPRAARLVGTAFDYLLRFEVNCHAPRARGHRWVAEAAPDLIHRRTATGTVLRYVLDGVPEFEQPPPEQVRTRVEAVLDEAKAAVARFLSTPQPDDRQLREVAGHALRLAKLDVVYRRGLLDPQYAEVKSDDVAELVALLKAAPLEKLVRPGQILLNPSFGEASTVVGGVDADIIAGGTLIDFKTVGRDAVEGAELDQLAGYLLLARRSRATDPSMPEIEQLALYFSRHAYLWAWDARVWTSQPDFAGIEEQFFALAQAGR
jgi:hypothetical protein